MPLTTWLKVARHRLFPLPVCIVAISVHDVGRRRTMSTVAYLRRAWLKMWGAIAISLLCHAYPEIQCNSGLNAAILFSGCRRMSVNVDDGTVELGMVENMRVAVGISLITCPEK